MYRASIAALTLICAAVVFVPTFAAGNPDVGAEGNGLSIQEEVYLERYATAHEEFGAAAVGANIVDDGTGQFAPYDVPDGIVAAKSAVLEAMLNPPPAPEPVAVEAAPAPETTSTYSGGAASSTVMCESGGDYAANTGNGYYGGYQFDSGTWDAYGDPAYGEANEAPPAVQDAAAASVPYDAWPSC